MEKSILKFILILWFLYTDLCISTGQQKPIDQNHYAISIEWQNCLPKGTLEVTGGKISGISISKGQGKINGNHFEIYSADKARLDIMLSETYNHPGSEATIISVRTDQNPFSFFLRDVSKTYPIYIPGYQVIVTGKEDARSYRQIEEEIQQRGLQTKLEKIESEPEESFNSASVHTRNQACPTWLGLSRDIRIFEISNGLNSVSREVDVITPMMASSSVKLPELNNNAAQYSYVTGRGQGVEVNVNRHLEEGVLPILHTILADEEVKYHSIAFVALENSPLTEQSITGTDFLVADNYSTGHMFTKEQEEKLKSRLIEESGKTEETVLYCRVQAINTSGVPRYAWFKTIKPGAGWWMKVPYSYDKENGISSYSPERVFGVSRLNGKPLPDEEIGVLLNPEDTAVFEFFLPHNPVSKLRALQLARQSFDEKLKQCQNFWKNKLNRAAHISLPEKRIEEMIQAGLLHLDLITYGTEPGGTLAPCIGVYSPIGTESSPIIQLYCSMGWQNIARRSLMYFLEKQHQDGLMQNFGGYMIETGAALWSMGEYFRYFHDTAWIRQVKQGLLKSCEYLIQWRERNKNKELIGKGYGMIDGKVADPEDPYHQFMLNGYAYLGISRVAEMLISIDSASSGRLKREAEAWKQDIRTSFFNSMANSPVVPFGDGTWCPTAPPWTESIGPRALFIKPEKFYSHGTFTVPDALLGPLYLIFCEVINPDEEAARILLNYCSELFFQRNAAFSQPYYCPNAWIELKMGLIKPYLKTYYNTFSALADRETYTFWEHLFKASPHKTHEEGWFLMQTRWMLYLEENQTLKLLPGIPREWLEDGKKIEIKNAVSYFGPLSFVVNSSIKRGFIEATIDCSSDRMPENVTLRLPHPMGKKPKNVIGGNFDYNAESVKIEPFRGVAHIRIEY